MEEITNDQVLTIGVFEQWMMRFEQRLDEKYATKSELRALESKMMDGFETMFSLYEKIDQKLDDALMIKADKVDVSDIHKRVVRLENKLV